MSPHDLAKAVVHWLEFQRLCRRSDLFSEAFLAQPIGEYCLAQQPKHFESEVAYPKQYQPTSGRRRSMDYAIFGPSTLVKQDVLRYAIEAKFITTKRVFTQEIYDDLYRLLWFEPTRDPAACKRFFLAVGYEKNMVGKKGLGATIGKGSAKIPAIGRLLPQALQGVPNVTRPIHTAKPGVRELWVEAAKAFGQKEVPDSISLRLRARYPAKPRPTGLLCMIWEIKRPATFTSTHPL